RVAARAVHHEVGDEPPDGGGDLEAVPGEPGGDDEPGDRGPRDGGVEVRRDVVAAGVAAGDGRVAEPGEAVADLLDGALHEVLGGVVRVAVGVGGFQLGEVAVAEQDLARHLGAHVLQRHQV